MIKLTFACGHLLNASGNEERPRCGCGETKITKVETRAPKFRGHVLGPCAQFENLPATAVSLKGKP